MKILTGDDFIHVLKSFGADYKRAIVVLYFLEHCNRDTNLFHGSYDSIARDTGVSYTTVVKTMKAMVDANYIEQVKRGLWRIIDTSIFEPPKDNHGLVFSIRSYDA